MLLTDREDLGKAGELGGVGGAMELENERGEEMRGHKRANWRTGGRRMRGCDYK